ncbi:MAG: DUF6809 family protein [Limisphaerales bacterium]
MNLQMLLLTHLSGHENEGLSEDFVKFIDERNSRYFLQSERTLKLYDQVDALEKQFSNSLDTEAKERFSEILDLHGDLIAEIITDRYKRGFTECLQLIFGLLGKGEKMDEIQKMASGRSINV